jgi:RNA polymerase sigma factor (sigma-70 family)
MSSLVYKMRQPLPPRACEPTSGAGAKSAPLAGALLRAQSDTRLMRLASQGYETAFEALVLRYRGSLLRYCQRFLPGALAEDVVQQAFLELWSALEDGREVRDVRPWLYRVVHNAALNTIRRGGYRCDELQEIHVGAGDSSDVAFEHRSALREALAGLVSLPRQQREAMTRSAVDGDSRAQIALAMGVSDAAVGQLLHRARVSLRAAMTALTPWPLATWAAGGGNYDVVTATRVVELTTTGGGGAADMLFKGSATLAVLAVASTAPLGIVRAHVRGRGRPQPISLLAPASQSLEGGLGATPSLIQAIRLPAGSFSLVRAVRAPRTISPAAGATGVAAPSVGGAGPSATSAPGASLGTSTGAAPGGGPAPVSVKASAPPAADPAISAETQPPSPEATPAPLTPTAESAPQPPAAPAESGAQPNPAPAEAPPAEAPPAEAPPGEAPPAEAPPAETPPSPPAEPSSESPPPAA